tara:strand:- start:3450 stop:4130 length:681 start_codon:yes stop_codon:yes gene_type:complete
MSYVKLTVNEGKETWEMISEGSDLTECLNDVKKASGMNCPFSVSVSKPVQAEVPPTPEVDTPKKDKPSDDAGTEDPPQDTNVLKKKFIIALGNSEEGMKVGQIKKAIDADPTVLKAIKDALLEDGYLEKEGERAGTIYSLSAKGNKAFAKIQKAAEKPGPTPEPEPEDDDLSFDDDGNEPAASAESSDNGDDEFSDFVGDDGSSSDDSDTVDNDTSDDDLDDFLDD